MLSILLSVSFIIFTTTKADPGPPKDLELIDGLNVITYIEEMAEDER